LALQEREVVYGAFKASATDVYEQAVGKSTG